MTTDTAEREEVFIHDFVRGRGHGHSTEVFRFGDGWEIDLLGWGGDRNPDMAFPHGTGRFCMPRTGDYLKLPTEDPDDPSYYCVDRIRHYGDPPDMWEATANFMPGSKMLPLLERWLKEQAKTDG